MRYKGLKGKAWDALRHYVYQRDNYTCVTCGRSRDQGYQIQAGHYLPMGSVGSNNKLSWDEFNIHAQCAKCNSTGQGEQELMASHIQRTYGKKKLTELKSRRYKVDPIKNWQIIIDYYNEIRSKLR